MGTLGTSSMIPTVLILLHSNLSPTPLSSSVLLKPLVIATTNGTVDDESITVGS
jgi:hypothetical protein